MARILAGDDSPINLQFLASLLGYDGHSVLEASDGQEALDITRDQHPDVIIADIQMPTMDGYEFVTHLRNDPGVAPTPAFASDAVMALSIAKNEAPDLILLDLGLPGGDGFLVLERMKNIPSLACTPVIVVSARDPERNKERAMKAGVEAFFQKPVDNAELLKSIRQALTK